MKRIIQIGVLLFLLLTGQRTFASHSMGLDVTYICLGGDTFLVTLKFYRDCEGVAAPSSANVNFSSVSCGYNYTENIPLVSFQELDVVCASLQTTCSGGTYPGAEEYVYSKTIILPDTCADWIVGYSLCCRNNAINTINNPGDERIYAEAHIDNTIGECNSSPIFTNNPVPFMCVGKSYCFNNGATDPDGDSLAYSLITPTSGINSGDTVQYIAGYSAQQPISSTPPLSLDPVTGDICMTPTMLGEVSVMQVLIKEYRNGVLIGTVERDIQLRVIDCPNDNNLPFADGIDGTGVFNTTVCAGQAFSFFTNSVDIDATNNVAMTWNQGIPDAAFAISAGTRPVGTFSWTPDGTDISATPYCFTVNLVDDNCPFLGSQVFSYCITVVGLTSEITAVQNIDCFGNCNGSATVQETGGIAPYNYLWNDPSAQIAPSATGLCAGSYSVTITDNAGCTAVADTVVTSPLLLDAGIAAFTDVTCKGNSDGTATAAESGGASPYGYSWSSGGSAVNESGLPAGSYTVTVTDSNGCKADTVINIAEPAQALTLTTTFTDALCDGSSDGTATVIPSGGYGVYSYLWDATTSGQTTQTATGLSAGSYMVTVTDGGNCIASSTVNIGEPLALGSNVVSTVDKLCPDPADLGEATVQATGGTSPYTFAWSTGATGNNPALMVGTHLFTATDANGCEAINSVVINDASLSVTITNTNSVCGSSNGSFTTDVAGGQSPYFYIWSNAETTSDVSGLAAGSYTVSVSDSRGCLVAGSGIINDPVPILTMSDSTDVTCFGGSDGMAHASAAAGTTPYIFLWTDGQTDSIATGLFSGNHYVTVTDGLGCKRIDFVGIDQPMPVIAITDSVPATCFGINNGDATVTVSGGTSPYSYQWDATTDYQTTPTAFGVGAGNYLVTITDSNGCVHDTMVVVTEPTLLELDTSFTNVSCFGGNDGTATVYPAGGTSPYAYLWDNTAGSQVAATAGSLTAGIYLVTVTDNNGCKKVTSATIDEPAVLELDTLFTNASCYSGSDGSATVMAIGGITPYTCLWDNNAGGQTSFTATGLAALSYMVTVTDNNFCIETVSANVGQPAQLQLFASSTPVSCFGGNDGTTSITVTGGTAPYSYLWDVAAGNQGDSTATGLPAGNYLVTVTDANSCIAVLSNAVTVTEPQQALSVTITTNDVSCNGGSDGIINAAVTGGTGSYAYEWNDSQTASGISGLTANTFSLSVTDNNNCLEIVQAAILEPAALSINTLSSSVSCYGFSDGSCEAVLSGGVSAYNYLWNNSVITENNTAIPAGTYFVTATDANGCEIVSSIAVTQPQPLTISVTGDAVSCNSGTNGVGNVIASGGISPFNYQWDVNAAFQNGTQAVNLSPGDYVISVFDANLCLSTGTATIGQPSAITLTTTPEANSICPGQNQLIGVMATGGSGNYTYNWDNGLASGQTQNVTPLVNTTYNVTAVDNNGCSSAPENISITVMNLQNSLSITATPSICPGEQAPVTAAFEEEFPPYSYIWQGMNANNQGIYFVSPSQTTTYYLTVIDQCGDSVNDSVTVSVYDLPDVLVSPSGFTGCAPLQVSFFNSGDTSVVASYLWNFGDGFLSSLSTPEHTYENNGFYQVSLEVVTNDGCTVVSSGSAYINVNPSPVADFVAQPKATDIRTPEIDFTSTSSLDVVTFAWDFGDGNVSSLENPTNIYADTGTYQVSLFVTNQYGCSDQKTDDVLINPFYNFDVPTAFIPNKSGGNGGVYNVNNLTNEVFFAFTDYISEIHMMIFNRWGEMIFESFDLNIGWDGYYLGELCQQDVYVWKVQVKYTNGTEETKVGGLTLIR